MSRSDESRVRPGASDESRVWRRHAYRNGVLLTTIPSLVVGVLTVLFSTRVPQAMRYPAELAASVVRSVQGIAEWSRQPSTVVLIMGWQWAFVPLYVGIWFVKLSPWGRGLQAGIGARLEALDTRTRVKLAIGFLFMVVYLFADVGLIPFVPTALNAKWAYPPSRASQWLLPIYHSDFFLMLYAWFAPLAEVSIWWALAALIPHIPKVFGLPR